MIKPLLLILNMRFHENLETMFQLGVAHTLRCLSAFLYYVICLVFRQELFIFFCYIVMLDLNNISCAT